MSSCQAGTLSAKSLRTQFRPGYLGQRSGRPNHLVLRVQGDASSQSTVSRTSSCKPQLCIDRRSQPRNRPRVSAQPIRSELRLLCPRLRESQDLPLRPCACFT